MQSGVDEDFLRLFVVVSCFRGLLLHRPQTEAFVIKIDDLVDKRPVASSNNEDCTTVVVQDPSEESREISLFRLAWSICGP